jgi:hypothetical protein
MKKVGIFYWVGEGTALGFIREGGIIKGDTDVDCGMYYENKTKYYDECLPLLLNEGFTIFRDYPHAIIKNNCYIDVDFVGLGKPSMTYQWPKISDPWFHLLQPFSKINIRGTTYIVPSIRYIIYLYGNDFMIPKHNFKPWDVERDKNSNPKHIIRKNFKNHMAQFF